MRKSVILTLFGISCYLILKEYYKTNSGMPTPNVFSKPAYAFGVLLIGSDFLETLPVVFAFALTVSLAYQAENIAGSKKATKSPNTKKNVPTTATSTPPRKVG